MINTLSDCRFHSVPETLHTAPGLAAKVSPQGELLPFPGNTVVFLLEEGSKQQLRLLQKELYQRCGALLAQPLLPDTFHMTLHDLANGDCLFQKEEMGARAADILDAIRREPEESISMRAVCSFNMVNTSVVLLLEPADETSWQQLDGLYLWFQQVRELPYALTPHITLAYYRPGSYGPEETARLRSALGEVDFPIRLSTRNLVLQDFDHMNAYHTAY